MRLHRVSRAESPPFLAGLLEALFPKHHQRILLPIFTAVYVYPMHGFVRHDIDARASRWCLPRLEVTRTDRVHSHALGAELACHAACELEDTRFGRVVGYVA